MTRVLLVSPGHSPDRTSRQPWAYIQGIANQLDSRGHEVVIAGDGPLADGQSTRRVEFRAVESVRDPERIENVSGDYEPDICIWSVGPTTSIYLAQRFPDISAQMIALVPGPLYSPREIFTQLSSRDLLDLPSYASLTASSFVPLRWFSHFLRKHFDTVVAPTTTIIDQTTSTGFPESDAIHVPHGRDSGILAREPDEEFRDSVPRPPDEEYVLNFGPPRPIRGVRDFLEAILELRESGREVVGVLLARIDDEEDREKLVEIIGDLEARGVRDSVHIVDVHLSHAELIEYIRSASAVALPYRIVQSTVPISIIEALGLERPVITTDVNGAKELVPSSACTVPTKNGEVLARKVGDVLSGTVEPRTEDELMANIPKWGSAIEPLASRIGRDVR